MDLALAIDHVQLAMPRGGEPEARIFFGEILGLPELAKPADVAARGGCWFGLGNQQLHLGVDGDFRPAKKAHVALAVDRLDFLRGHLEQAGCVTQSEGAIEGRHRFFTEDPFGNRIEFIDRTPRE